MRRREFLAGGTLGLSALAGSVPVRAYPEKRLAASLPTGAKCRVAVIGRTGRGNYGHGMDTVWNEIEQADEMVAAFEKRKLKLAIAHQTRYSPALLHVQKAIAEGMLGDLLELRGRGKEDQRGGGEDLMVLGTHIMDLMRFFVGEARWCFAQVSQGGKPVIAKDVRAGAEGIGPLAGDEIHAMYRFDGVTIGYFSTHRARQGASARFGLQVYGSKGILTMTTGAVPEIWFVEDPSWQPGRGQARWKPVSSEGIDKPERLSDPQQGYGNRLIALDLIHAIETDSRPQGSAYDGRAALEMILAVYESHRRSAPVPLPLQNRRHPLSGWS